MQRPLATGFEERRGVSRRETRTESEGWGQARRRALALTWEGMGASAGCGAEEGHPPEGRTAIDTGGTRVRQRDQGQ